MAAPVISHHGRSNFLYSDTITLEGKVIEFKWRNPHSYMEIETKNKNNETEIWLIEVDTPTSLKRQGWQKDSIKADDEVLVVGNPDRDRERKFLLLDRIVRGDGKTFYVSHIKRTVGTIKELVRTSTASEKILPSHDFSGTWRRGPDNSVTGRYFEPPSDWPLTNQGEAQVARFDSFDNPAYDCLERGLPFFTVKNYDFLWTRYQDRIEIIHQLSTSPRTIYLNQNNYLDDLKPSLMGHSIAHFDDDGNLLVDTVGFTDGVRWGLAPRREIKWAETH